MKTNQQITPAAPDWTRAKSLLAELKSTVRLVLTIQILAGKELVPIKKQLFSHGGDRKGSSRQLATCKTWDQYCREELGIAARSADRYIQCFEAAKARASNLKAKASSEYAKALSAGETKDSAKWKKLIKKFDAVIGLLQTPAAELSGEETKVLAAHVGFLIQRQDRDKFPTAAYNITQGELLEELGIKTPSKSIQDQAKSKHRNDKQFQQMSLRDLFAGIRQELGDIATQISRQRNSDEFKNTLKSLLLAAGDENVPKLLAIRASLLSTHESLESVLKNELKEMIKDVDLTIEAKMKGDSTAPAKPRRLKHTKA